MARAPRFCRAATGSLSHPRQGTLAGQLPAKLLSLSADGRLKVATIHAHARQQVEDALRQLKPGQERSVLQD